MPASGDLRSGRVVVEDEREGNQLYNKGAFGEPRSGGGLLLSLVEAAYLVEEGKLIVRDAGRALPLEGFVSIALRLEAEFEIRYLVLRDLRKRGYLAKPAVDAPFHLYPRGGFPGTTASTHVVFPVSERGTFDTNALLHACERAAALGKRVLLAIVDEEGDITFYEASQTELSGNRVASQGSLAGKEATLSDERAGAWNEELIATLRTEGCGNLAGPVLRLSLVEAVHLQERGLSIREAKSGRILSREDLASHARKVQPDFDLRLRAFRLLQSRGLAVKTGFKFGTHFRAYKDAPGTGHAPFLVHALPEGYSCPWSEVSGAVRLSHTVRKNLVFAIGDRFLKLKRARP